MAGDKIRKILFFMIFIIFSINIHGMEIENFSEPQRANIPRWNAYLSEELIRQGGVSIGDIFLIKIDQEISIENPQQRKPSYTHSNSAFSRNFLLITLFSLMFASAVDALVLPATILGFHYNTPLVKDSLYSCRANRVSAIRALKNKVSSSVLGMVSDISASGINPSHEHFKACYHEDLAYIHDRGFTKFIKEISPSILEEMRKYRIKNGTVVDLGCGSGFWINELIEKGYNGIGVDISPSMIDIARKNAPLGEFVVESFVNYKLPPCQVVTALYEQEFFFTHIYGVFNYIDHQITFLCKQLISKTCSSQELYDFSEDD